MGGCTNCKGKSGCDHRKGAMMECVDQALAELYPTRTWGEPNDEIADGMPREELDALADELAQELGAATFVRAGGDDEPCDYIYVLCMGRTPCVVQVRDHDVARARPSGATPTASKSSTCASWSASVRASRPSSRSASI